MGTSQVSAPQTCWDAEFTYATCCNELRPVCLAWVGGPNMIVTITITITLTTTINNADIKSNHLSKKSHLYNAIDTGHIQQS